ncbi:hypothetical protein GCM10027578_22270 [Spirosoma luteolum]
MKNQSKTVSYIILGFVVTSALLSFVSNYLTIRQYYLTHKKA